MNEYLILNKDGEAVALTDKGYDEAARLRDMASGAGIVPVEEYVAPEGAYQDAESLRKHNRRRDAMTPAQLQEIADCVSETLNNDADGDDGYDWDNLGLFLAYGGFPMTLAEEAAMREDEFEEHLRQEVRQAAQVLGVTVSV